MEAAAKDKKTMTGKCGLTTGWPTQNITAILDGESSPSPSLCPLLLQWYNDIRQNKTLCHLLLHLLNYL